MTTLATLALPVVVGSAGLALDLNRGYQARMIAQRTADLAAPGAAMAYKTGNNVQILTPTARDIALCQQDKRGNGQRLAGGRLPDQRQAIGQGHG